MSVTDRAALSLAAALLTAGVAGLTRLTPAEVRARLGEPAVARAEAAGALWTYRLPRCALFVYFSDEGQGLKVSGAESGPRRYGETPPDADACLAAASATPATSPGGPSTSVPLAPTATAPVTAAPITSAPLTSAPVTSAPVTTAPATDAPSPPAPSLPPAPSA